jgi:hypothetical protein
MQRYQDWQNPRCEILKALAKMKPISRNLCLICKGGRLLCKRSYCPLNLIYTLKKPVEQKLKEEIYSPSPPSIFVGWKGYPKVFVGPLNALSEDAELLDNPAKWYGLDFDKIVEFRTHLIRGKRICAINNVNDKFVESLQELILSQKSIWVETRFKRKPKYSLTFSPIAQPIGPSAEIEKFKLTENPSIPRKVESVINDDLKAGEQIFSLYEKGFDVYYLTKVFSAGIFGKQRKLVPTRWSITAIDSILANKLIEQIRNYPTINEYLVWENTYLENHFEILFLPSSWGFEQFEAWAPKTLWTLAETKPIITVEREGFHGRNDYAIKEGGGYYASKLAACEQLARMRRQACVIVFREIYDSYIMPVGVWEVRENVRHAFNKKPKRFSSLKEALEDIKQRLTLPLEEYLKRSYFLRQRKLEEFL